MKIHLVRHARAVPRSDWKGKDLLRPLSDWGHDEALAIADHLANEPLERIVSCPDLRCQQTVVPLAVSKGLVVEVDERLARDEDVERVLELMPAPDDGPVLFCTHAEPIVALFQVFELGDVGAGGRMACKKGSIWVLDGADPVPRSATYFEPERESKRHREVSYSEREVARPRSVRVGVLDMGSTSFTLLIADGRRDGEILPVVSEKVMLRLAATVARNGELPAEVFSDAVEVARDLHAVTLQEKVERLAVVATAAVREATNGQALATAVSEAIGQPVRVLSGEEEARTCFRAFRQRLDLGERPVVGIDLGGGSLELALGSAAGVSMAVTLPAGVLRLKEELVRDDPMGELDIERLRKRVRATLAPHLASFRNSGAAFGVAAGGTVRALARLVVEKRTKHSGDKLNDVVLGSGVLRELADQLAHATAAERLRMRGIRRRRADALPIGAIILQTLAEELRLDALRVCDWGLREGVLLDVLER